MILDQKTWWTPCSEESVQIAFRSQTAVDPVLKQRSLWLTYPAFFCSHLLWGGQDGVKELYLYNSLMGLDENTLHKIKQNKPRACSVYSRMHVQCTDASDHCGRRDDSWGLGESRWKRWIFLFMNSSHSSTNPPAPLLLVRSCLWYSVLKIYPTISDSCGLRKCRLSVSWTLRGVFIFTYELWVADTGLLAVRGVGNS